MQKYSIENDLLKHPQRMLISSFKLENGSIITLLFNFYMEPGLNSTKFTALYRISLESALTSFFSQHLMLEGKEMRILYPVI